MFTYFSFQFDLEPGGKMKDRLYSSMASAMDNMKTENNSKFVAYFTEIGVLHIGEFCLYRNLGQI